MATTEELIQQLRDYRYRDSDRREFVRSLTDIELSQALGNATTWSQAWVRVLEYSRKSGRTEPARPRTSTSSNSRMTTAEFVERLAPLTADQAAGKDPMCWELVVEAFGITGKRTGRRAMMAEIASKLTEGKYSVERVKDLTPKSMTLSTFLKGHLTGDWIISTPGHCLAIRDGVIHDTQRSSTVARRVVLAYRVRSARLTVPKTCECSNDLVVFGHQPRCSNS